MAEYDMTAELAALKLQLEKLEQDRFPAAPPAPESVTKNANEKGEDWLDGLESLEPEQILERLKAGAGEWFDELNSELKDAKPSTVLTIFGLGVVIGRLTQ